MIASASSLAVELDELANRLAPLVLQLKGLVEARDRIIALRLADEGEPCTVDGQDASTTHTGYDVVLDTFKQFDEITFCAPFDAVNQIGSLIESYEWAGLHWGVDGAPA
jgi:hypothetical protein